MHSYSIPSQSWMLGSVAALIIIDIKRMIRENIQATCSHRT